MAFCGNKRTTVFCISDLSCMQHRRLGCNRFYLEEMLKIGEKM